LTTADAELVELGFPAMVSALSSGAVDVALLPEPLATLAVDGGSGTKWKGFADIVPGFQQAVVVFTPEFAAQRDLATRWTTAYLRGIRDSLRKEAPTTAGRLVRTGMSAWGDFSIEFVLRVEGDAAANRAMALEDMLAVASAVYEGPPPRPLNVTLLGVWRPSATASTLPLLYASFPAERLVGLDWSRLQPDDLPTLGVVRCLPSGVCQAWHECGAGFG